MALISDDNIANIPAVAMLIDIFCDMPSPITNGAFNRRMFIESIIQEAGWHCSLEEEDICYYSGMTQREFIKVSKTLIKEGIILKIRGPYAITLYGLNLTLKEEFKNAKTSKEIIEQEAASHEDRRHNVDRRVKERRRTRNHTLGE